MTRWSRLLFVALLLGALASQADAVDVAHQGSPTMATRAWPVATSQGFTLLNAAPTTSAANTASTVTLTGATNFRVCLRALYLFSSAAGTATLTVQDGATVFLNFGTITTGAQFTSIPLPTGGFCAATGNNIVVNIGANAAGVTNTTSAIGDRS